MDHYSGSMLSTKRTDRCSCATRRSYEKTDFGLYECWFYSYSPLSYCNLSLTVSIEQDIICEQPNYQGSVNIVLKQKRMSCMADLPDFSNSRFPPPVKITYSDGTSACGCASDIATGVGPQFQLEFADYHLRPLHQIPGRRFLPRMQRHLSSLWYIWLQRSRSETESLLPRLEPGRAMRHRLYAQHATEKRRLGILPSLRDLYLVTSSDDGVHNVGKCRATSVLVKQLYLRPADYQSGSAADFDYPTGRSK